MLTREQAEEILSDPPEGCYWRIRPNGDPMILELWRKGRDACSDNAYVTGEDFGLTPGDLVWARNGILKRLRLIRAVQEVTGDYGK